ncbi:hypothetical protein HanXRQr2_Chr11g0473291 [Helianthus annuus]|uniref:Uncharacterized protein n=1 Tax=Helianthus annuus TaxID=4232 RepID=A0A251T9M6_HELAN|nr:hypothetical protein HanXRQr2_Chr11g0473291 [Helianthus annuus]KAJ0507774.1 hypothetical protein HanIR_Chr11g0509921 [Helianthus annuus]KAJ0873782.1 hypothetical protein HanPSC8_Chr11g0456411 [Helianthus annuus]
MVSLFTNRTKHSDSFTTRRTSIFRTISSQASASDLNMPFTIESMCFIKIS